MPITVASLQLHESKTACTKGYASSAVVNQILSCLQICILMKHKIKIKNNDKASESNKSIIDQQHIMNALKLIVFIF